MTHQTIHLSSEDEKCRQVLKKAELFVTPLVKEHNNKRTKVNHTTSVPQKQPLPGIGESLRALFKGKTFIFSSKK